VLVVPFLCVIYKRIKNYLADRAEKLDEEEIKVDDQEKSSSERDSKIN
jgi:hypothetical protein